MRRIAAYTVDSGYVLHTWKKMTRGKYWRKRRQNVAPAEFLAQQISTKNARFRILYPENCNGHHLAGSTGAIKNGATSTGVSITGASSYVLLAPVIETHC